MLISPLHHDLCLSYANTLSWRGTPAPAEALHDLPGLLHWLRQSAGLSAVAVRDSIRWARDRPGKRAQIFTEAIDLREALYRLFSAVSAGKPVRRTDLALLQRALAAAPARRTLVPSSGAYAWQIGPGQPTAPHLLAPVLWSAGDLLVAGARRRVRRCANDKCLWLFLDESRNATRRWCDMASCGNRAKARRHYLRSKRR